MRVLVEGSGGSAGWPEPGCRCASCLRQAARGNARKKSTIVVDGSLRLGAELEDGDGKGSGDGDGDGSGDGDGEESAAGYQVRRVPDLR
ncbi:MAG TPA: hypothetical protein VK594_08795, partial [Streptosporangiaceae bacterium]|nr:hypothetical protein [Streptosporangiaceae bacterium]